MSGQLNPTPIVEEHFHALRQEDGRLSPATIVEQVLLPAASAGVAYWQSMRVSLATGVALLTLSGLFAAFFLQLTIQLLDRAASWSETRPEPSASTSRYATLLTSLAANASYATLIAIACAGSALAVAISTRGWQERVLAALTLGLFVHMALTLLVTVRRVFVTTAAKLRDVRTGADRDMPAPAG